MLDTSFTTDPLAVTSVWLTCQQPARDQRRGRYVPQTSSHPGKMLPHLAAHAITTYTAPGDLVLDPMCGSAPPWSKPSALGRDAHRGRHRTPLHRVGRGEPAPRGGRTGHRVGARSSPATPPTCSAMLPDSSHGKVALVLTSPPYGRGTHGLVRATTAGISKRDHLYGDRERRQPRLRRAGTGCSTGSPASWPAAPTMLRPGGTVVITCRPVRRHRDDFIDLPGELLAVAASVGLTPVQRCAAMLAAVRDGQIVHRASMFGLMAVRRARADGIPVHLVAHEDVLVLRKIGSSASSAGTVTATTG